MIKPCSISYSMRLDQKMSVKTTRQLIYQFLRRECILSLFFRDPIPYLWLIVVYGRIDASLGLNELKKVQKTVSGLNPRSNV